MQTLTPLSFLAGPLAQVLVTPHVCAQAGVCKTRLLYGGNRVRTLHIPPYSSISLARLRRRAYKRKQSSRSCSKLKRHQLCAAADTYILPLDRMQYNDN